MSDGLSSEAYDALVAAAETYRAAVVIRLAGEAGLRTAEITRVRPGGLRESDPSSTLSLLAVPETADEPERGDAEVPPVDRETVVPQSLAAELRRYADSTERGDDDPFVDVSPRRVQMIVSETARRAADQTDGAVPVDVTPRDLRATFARRLLVDRGVNPHAVREAGGWESMGSLDDYLGPLDGDAVAEAVAADAVDAVADQSAVAASRDPAALRGFEAIVDPGNGRGEGIAGDSAEVSPLASVPESLTAGDRWAEAWVVRGWVDGERAENRRCGGYSTRKPSSTAVRPTRARGTRRLTNGLPSPPTATPRPRGDRCSRFPSATAR